jgi:glucokinase
MGVYLGLDVGGTKVAAGVVTAEGTVLSRLRQATRDLRAGGEPLPALIALGRQALRAAGAFTPAGVGLGLPGPVDSRSVRMLAARRA